MLRIKQVLEQLTYEVSPITKSTRKKKIRCAKIATDEETGP